MQLRLEHLVKDFSGTLAVDDVNLTIADGKLTGLLGPSGCGKSTLLYLISGLEQPTSGRIYFGDDDVTDTPAEKRGIGLVFQNYALYPHMTVEQNIIFPLRNAKIKRKIACQKAAEMARFVQIEDLLKRRPSQLSGGQQQRVAIARALIKSPKVLLLDEPLSNLDARLRLELREEIRGIQIRTGVTTVFVTHDQEEAMSITDQIVLMKKGVVQQVCSPYEMYCNPENKFVAAFLGNPPIDFFTVQAVDGIVPMGNGLRYRVKESLNGELIMGIRPESWKQGKGVRVTVKNLEIRGREQLVNFDIFGNKARAILDGFLPLHIDDELELTLTANTVYLFDPQTGNRVDNGGEIYAV